VIGLLIVFALVFDRDEEVVGDSADVLEDPLCVRVEVLECLDRVDDIELVVVEVADDVFDGVVVECAGGSEVG